MKQTLRVMAVATLFAAAPAYAQGGMGGGGGMRGNPEQMMARQKEMLFKDITLSAEQTTKVDSIMTASMGKQREMMQAMRGGGGDMSAMREQGQKMTEERNTAIKAVLTDDQKKKFEENLANMPQGRRGG